MDPISVTVAAATAAATRQVARKKLAEKKMKWLEEFMPAAYKVCAEYGVPPQVCVAQAALESGWGAKAGGYNYFGLKGSGTAGSSTFASTEYIGGQKDAKTTKVSKFAKFKNMEDGIRGYCIVLTSNKLFKPASVLYPNDPGRFITWLWGKSYASGPNYPGMVISVMRTIYRATGDEAYNVYIDPELAKVINTLRTKTMGTQRWAATDKLLNPNNVKVDAPTVAGLAGGKFLPGYRTPGEGLAGGHFQPGYNIPGTLVPMGMSGMGTLAGEGAKALEDETSPLWWILPALAVGLGIELYLHYRKKA